MEEMWEKYRLRVRKSGEVNDGGRKSGRGELKNVKVSGCKVEGGRNEKGKLMSKTGRGEGKSDK